ncbi:hypothetical protein M409DRAFT_58886 [Zasmidium cellare ATCC 36951]|uniref:SGTA homodimerisation domain-containing protein n=1 Tax=Zasmidium cellare ATCC 36951 TaxID=1080233 RepID=A0A6A6C8Q5_ZASCE|nr:uncharacterized protein M409DRAFT_58886 [Zasmidium cellare ATCC 36951]KAF2161816.1 hypothetical protein M409DRAFT_58886 [Zasmidium cellare ATCC 36951]
MATDSRKRLALAIVDFLQSSLKDGTLQPEDADSIEIATNCIAECFHVDPNDKTAVQDALGGQNLLSIYGVYEKLKGKGTPAAAASGAAAGAVASTGANVDQPTPSGSPTEESEKLKGVGNAAMQKKDYQSAVDNYTKALEICPLNPIYLSNRAAAYSALNKHEFAKNDAELATATDPKYTKAWSRLGLARFALGDAKGAMEAYQQGIDSEGNGGSEAMKKGFETAKKKVEEEERAGADDDEDDDVADSTRGAGGAGGMPDLGGLASMLGGGGGGAGGLDLNALLSNPMMRSMAQNLMSNPEAMNNIMSNPQLRGMAERFGGGGGAGGQGGGGMPNLSELMNDPALRNLAQNFMGGAGAGGAGGAGGNAGNGGNQ